MQLGLFFAILLPIISGLLVYFVRNESFRKVVVLATALVVMGSAVYISALSYRSYSIHYLWNIDLSKVIEIGDFLLGLYILYLSMSLKNAWLILLTLFQLIPMFIFENFMGANLDVSNAIYMDHLSVIMNLIISFIGTLIWIYALSYMKEDEEHKNIHPSRQNRFFFLLMLFVGVMNALVFSNNLVWVYFFWEITTVCSFLLIGHDRTPEAKASATRALLLNSIGGVAFVVAIIYGYYQFDTVDMQALVAHRATGIMLLPFAFLCLSAFTKSAQIPFQSWLLGAMVAPTPVSALLHSSTMVKAGVYLVIRLVPAFYGTWLAGIVAVFGAFTFVAASFMAIGQSNAKRVLAYSTIANLGLIISAAAINSPTAIAAAIMLIIFHAVSKGLLFLCVGTIEHRIGSRDIEDMRGLINTMPFTAIITSIGLVTMLLPPFGVLLSKWLLIETAAKNPLIVILISIGSTLTVIYYARWIGTLLSRTTVTEKIQPEPRDRYVRIPLFVLAVSSVAISLFVTSVFNNLVAPEVFKYYHRLGIVAKEGEIATSSGAFVLWPIFLALGIALLIGYIALRAQHEYTIPYIPGEPIENFKEIKILGLREPTNGEISNYYFDGFISEGKLTLGMNLLGLLFIAVMFGVVIL